MQEYINQHEAIAKQQSVEVEQSKGKPIPPKTGGTSTPGESTFAPIPEGKVHTESGGLEELSKRPTERLDTGSSIRQEVMKRRLEKQRNTGETHEVQEVEGKRPNPTEDKARGDRLVGELKTASPEIRQHI